MRRSGPGPRGRRHHGVGPPRCSRGAVVVVAVHLTLAFLFGLMGSGGIFYNEWKFEFDTNDQQTATVDSIMVFTPAVCGFLGGFLTKHFGCRVSGILGSILMSLGVFFRVWVQNIRQMYVTSAVIGCGIGIAYNATMVVVAQYYSRRFAVANALASAGIGTGVMAVPPLVQALIDAYGWRGATLLVSAILANCVPFCALFRPTTRKRSPEAGDNGTTSPPVVAGRGDDDNDRDTDRDSARESDTLAVFEIAEGQARPGSIGRSPVNHSGPVQDSTKPSVLVRGLLAGLGVDLLVKSYRLALLCVFHVGFNMAYAIFAVYTVPFAQSLGVAPSAAVLLMSIFGAGSLAGRLANGPLLRRKLPAEYVTAACIALAAAAALLPVCGTYVALVLNSLAQGISSGFCFTGTVVLVRRYVGLTNLPVSLGILQISYGVGTFIGPITAGRLLDLTGNYHVIFYVTSGLNFTSALLMALTPSLGRCEPGMGDDAATRGQVL